MARLLNKVAVITGAARGIGRAIALRFAEEGCSLALSDLNLTGVQDTARECEAKGAAHGVRTATFPTNVTKRADVEAMVAGTVAQLGRLDILVNNAGIFNNAAFELMTDEQWDSMINVNLNSVLRSKSTKPSSLLGGPSWNLAATDTSRRWRCGIPGSAMSTTRSPRISARHSDC